MKNKIFLGSVTGGLLIVLIVYGFLTVWTHSCQEIYEKAYNSNNLISSNEDAYAAIKLFSTNESIEIKPLYRKDYTRRKINLLTANDVTYGVVEYSEEGKTGQKEMWILDDSAIDNNGVIYIMRLCL